MPRDHLCHNLLDVMYVPWVGAAQVRLQELPRLVMEFEKEIKMLSLIRRSWWICGGRWEQIRGPVSCPLPTMGIVNDAEDAVKTAELLDLLDGWSLELYLLSHRIAKVGPLWNEDSVLGSG